MATVTIRAAAITVRQVRGERGTTRSGDKGFELQTKGDQADAAVVANCALDLFPGA
jgi:hypothetical protein